MRRYFGYELDKLLKTPLMGFLIALPFLLISLQVHFTNSQFLKSYGFLATMIKSRHVFDYLLWKSAGFNAIILSFLVITLIYFIFYREYKSGAMTIILFSKGISKRIFREKSLTFMFIILSYVLFYILLISGYGYYFISEYSVMFAGQLKFLPVFFLEYIAVYLAFVLRTLFFILIYFKFFKANPSSLVVFIGLHIILSFFPYLPFTWSFSVVAGIQNFLLPALGYLVAFYILNIKLNEN
jgi:hypothetical protein